jgi:hypothetical protein
LSSSRKFVKQDRFHVWRRLLGKISQYHPQKKCLVHELKLLSEALSGGKVNTVKALHDRLNAIMQRFLQPHKQAIPLPCTAFASRSFPPFFVGRTKQ